MQRIPSSTYRLQLHKGFTFDDAGRIAEYLHDLGISHVYSSPYLQAAPGSMHGYDVVDHQRVNDELKGPGDATGQQAHERFCKTLGDTGLGQVLDIVPNHMSLGQDNRYWWDVIENGVSSRYASFFDIDWQPQEERLRDKVLVPILGDQYGKALSEGGIKVARRGGQFEVEAGGQVLPVAPTSMPAILARAAEYARSDTLSFLSASFGRLPSPDAGDRRAIVARHGDKLVLFQLLTRMCAEESGVCEAIDQSIADLNSNHDALDDFLSQQHYRLAYWKAADQQLGYRRFFDVNTLIALRMEREHVFEETHALVVDWLKKGVIDGVRVDHPDGLRDPLQYFRRLREHVPDGWIIGEKILEPGEFLRDEWPIDGTSGYDFLYTALSVLARREGLKRLGEIYAAYTGLPLDFPTIAHDKKINVTEGALASDVNRLASLFVEICECNRSYRDFTRAEIRRAIREVASCFGIYRTYVVPERNEITEEDRLYIGRATECAANNRTDVDPSLFGFMRDVLTLAVRGKLETEFVHRFQQFTSPVMAKGVEDTAFYCFDRLTAMNEVGGDPARDGISVQEFHGYNVRMQATHPQTMTSLSTHDTKRADDVRARMVVLTEVPEEFSAALDRWTESNGRYRTGEYPDRNTEYFFYQTLIGAWPLSSERARAYMQKAMREAKMHTSWVNNNREYEEALQHFIESTLADSAFVGDLEAFVGRIQSAGQVNALAQTLMKHTSPGVPDLYQGSELWDYSLVDPDNRRPVDFDLRRKLLDECRSLRVRDVLRRWSDGLPKLWVIHRSLGLRREHPEWFGRDATYAPVAIRGPANDHAIAYLRADCVLTVVPRFPLTLDAQWEGTGLDLAAGRWRNVLTDEMLKGAASVPMTSILGEFPVALLVREASADA